ncbi:hypothetical protein LBMAG53_36560 [Planctomycetota bacterium]|nr:hypothetical protein LBMAG53_36560 [Planctomycetota bacterium]
MRTLLLLLAAALLAAADPAGTVAVGPNPTAARFFHEKVQPVLAQHCLGCHGETKQKADLRLDSLAAMLRGGENGAALVPGDPAASPMITSLHWTGDLKMPPKEKLPDQDMAALTRWVELGAPWPTQPAETAGSATSGAAAPPKPPRPPFLGRLHPVLVHLPLGCLVVAVLAEFLVWWRGLAWRGSVTLLCAVGAAGSVGAIASGLALASDQDRDLLSQHQIMGFAVLILAVAATALATAAHRLPAVVWPLRITLVVTAAAAGLTGHLGGMMAWGRDWLP